MNTELESRTRRALLLARSPAERARWCQALAGNHFEVRVLPDKADPVFAAGLLEASGDAPSLVVASLAYFAGRNRNPYQFVKAFAARFPAAAMLLVQSPGEEVTDAMRALARRYGAMDLVPALPAGDGAYAAVEMIWFSACAQGPRERSGEVPALPVHREVAMQLRRQLAPLLAQSSGKARGAFRAADLMALAGKTSAPDAQVIAWMEELIKEDGLRSLQGEAGFIPGSGLYRFVTDEPAGIIAAGEARPADAADSIGTFKIRTATGASPAAAKNQLNDVAEAMRQGPHRLEIRDRSYLLKKYPACFIGSEAVAWLMQHRQLTRPLAIKMGERMFEAGLFHHVTDDHDFRDGNFYFRFYADEESGAPANTASGGAAAAGGAQRIDAIDVSQAAEKMRGAGGVEVATRRYLLKTYPKCLLGSEAVDWLAREYGVSRPLAVKLGERMVEAGLIHHVTDDHDFRDGDFFYRYYADESS
jgi:hypothetical protein